MRESGGEGEEEEREGGRPRDTEKSRRRLTNCLQKGEEEEEEGKAYIYSMVPDY